MQGVLTSREAWVRFSTSLLLETELTPEEIGAEADQMLIQYLQRFPDPKGLESARLTEDAMEFAIDAPGEALTDPPEAPPSEEGQS